MYEAMPIDDGELLAKLAQIQEQAEMTLDELPRQLAKHRLRLIIGLAKYLQNGVHMRGDASSEASNGTHGAG
jgi:hypothetical protein